MDELRPNAKIGSNLITIITRYHDQSRWAFLSECLNSVSLQGVEGVEQLVVCQNFSQESLNLCEEKINLLNLKHKVLVLNVPGDGDIRSKLLNVGIARANSMFLGFLDFDDILEVGALRQLLIEFEKTPQFSLIAGRVVVRLLGADGRVLRNSDPYKWASDKYDLSLNNFLPIHSYLISLKNVSRDELVFSEDLTLLEDYDFLVRLAVNPSFAMRLIPHVVGYHNLRIDGSNSTICHELDLEKVPTWNNAEKVVRARHSHLVWPLNSTELGRLVEYRQHAKRFVVIEKHLFLIALMELFRLAEKTGAMSTVISCLAKALDFMAWFCINVYRKLRNLVAFGWKSKTR